MSARTGSSSGEVWRLAWRAVRRRCPRCGAGGVWSSFMRMRPACANCGLPLDRGESDYFYGAYMLNIVAAELAAMILSAVALLLTWPNPPWTVLTYGAAAMAVLAPVLLYPMSKALWLALDLAFRPREDD